MGLFKKYMKGAKENHFPISKYGLLGESLPLCERGAECDCLEKEEEKQEGSVKQFPCLGKIKNNEDGK